MQYDSASPENRYAALMALISREETFLERGTLRTRRLSLFARYAAITLMVSATVVPLIAQVPQLASLPSWTSTLLLVLAAGVLFFDHSGMWTHNYTRWNTRLMRTRGFRDAFEATYARVVRLPQTSSSAKEQQLLSHIEEAVRALGTIRDQESTEWALRYVAVLARLSASVDNKDASKL